MKILLCVLTLLCVSCSQVTSTYQERREARQFVDSGVAKMREGALDAAQAAFEVALETAEIPEGYDGLGCIAFILGDYKQAQMLFLKAYEKDDNYAEALEHLALLYELQGFVDEADKLYLRAIEINPSLYTARNNRAVFKYELGEEGEAKSELLKASSIAKNDIIENNLKKLN